MTENDRVRLVREHFKLTLKDFGAKIPAAPNTLSNIENGNRSVTAQMRAAIVREYGVSEEWLAYGTGEMFPPKNEDEVLEDLFASIMDDPANSRVKRLAKAFAKLTDAQREQLAAITEAIVAAYDEDE